MDSKELCTEYSSHCDLKEKRAKGVCPFNIATYSPKTNRLYFTLAPSVGTYSASRSPSLHLMPYRSSLTTKAWDGIARAAPPQPVQDRPFEPGVLCSRYREKKHMGKVWCYTLLAKAQKLFVLHSLLQKCFLTFLRSQTYLPYNPDFALKNIWKCQLSHRFS